MKKFAWMFAALALCAGSMVACGDDDKKANGEECIAQTDCQSDFCAIEEGKDKGVCADKTDSSDKKANGEACENNDECQSGNCAEGDNGKTCAAAESSDKKANGEACKNNDECQSGNCAEGDNGKTCAEKKCTDDASCGDGKKCVSDKCIVPECTKNADCTDELKSVCDFHTYTCVVSACGNFQPACKADEASGEKTNILISACTVNEETGEAQYEEIDCSQNTDGNTECDDNRGACVPPQGREKECMDNSDCKDATKPYCVADVCVAEPADVDPCKEINCQEGECQWGVCVTDAMKNATAAADIPAAGFCDGDTLYYVDDNSKVAKIDCAATGWGKCVGYAEFSGAEAGFDCSGTADMLERCATEGANKLEISACLQNNVRSNVYCIEDLKGNAMALPKYEIVADEYEKCADKGQVCGYDADNAAVCKAAE